MFNNTFGNLFRLTTFGESHGPGRPFDPGIIYYRISYLYIEGSFVMIFSSIHTKDDFKNYPAAVQRAIEYLKNNDFTKMETGVYEIEGKLMYAQVFDAETEPLEARKPEYHEKYLDVQFLVTGREKLGFTPDTGNYEVAERYDERDLIFVKDVENEGFITSTPGCFCVFFPTDIHRPQVADGEPMKVRKVVVKVSVELLK